jgi:NAD(P)H-dependent FMN reductase
LTSKTLNILAIAGSLRSEFFNRKALQMAKQIASEFNVNVVELDLKTLALPLFNQDLKSELISGISKEIKRCDSFS